MINRQAQSHAIAIFSRWLKSNESRFHGMSMDRIQRIVRESLHTTGYNTEPEYRLPFTDVRYVRGCLVKWNPKGGFNVTVAC